MTAQGYQTFKLGDWKLQCGADIPDAHIAYKTFGDSKLPAVVYPTWYSGCKYPTLAMKVEHAAHKEPSMLAESYKPSSVCQ